MNGVHLRHGNFHVVLNPDALGKMPRANFRKLLRLARTEMRNSLALQELKTLLENHVADATTAHQQAKKEFTDGWRLVSKSCRSKAAAEIRCENNRLQNTVKRTKAELNSAEALLKIYNEMEIY